MKIRQLIEQLQDLCKREGNLEVTCTGSTLEDGHGGPVPDVFETTVENLVVRDGGKLGKRVRLYL